MFEHESCGIPLMGGQSHDFFVSGLPNIELGQHCDDTVQAGWLAAAEKHAIGRFIKQGGLDSQISESRPHPPIDLSLPLGGMGIAAMVGMSTLPYPGNPDASQTFTHG